MAGVEGLNGQGAAQPRRYDIKSPGLAAVLSFVPGLGSAYNGLIIKALVHFAVIVGLWEVSDLFRSGLFKWGGFACYLYSMFNAFQDAKRLNRGEDLSGEEDRLKRLLRENTKVWGTGLIGIGVLTILRSVLPYPVMAGLWPLLLIALGAYLVFMYQRAAKPKATNQLPHDFRAEMPPVMSFDPIANDYTQAETRRFDAR